MKKLTDLFEMIQDTASRKARAGQARLGGSTPQTEKPRDVYLKACAEIGDQLAFDGFKFVSSTPAAKRAQGDFIDRVSFQSSHNNIAGEYVALWVHATVHSKRLKTWRKMNPFAGSVDHDLVAGGQIGNLQEPAAWLEWNLAANYQEQVRSAVALIRASGFPYFRRFETAASVIADVIEGTIPGMTVWNGIEYVLCFGDKDSANQAVAAFFRRRPELLPQYRDFVQRYAQDGVPVHSHMGFAKDLAKATVVFGLQQPAAN